MQLTTKPISVNLVALLILSAHLSAEPIRVDVNAGNRQIKVSPDLYGIFYEEINHAGDGGLYAEMVQNRSFEENELSDNMRLENGTVITNNGWRYQWKPKTDLRGWSAVSENGADAVITLDDAQPLNPQTPHSMRVSAAEGAGFANEGYWGMSVLDGDQYDLSFYARGENEVSLTVSLESADGSQVYAKDTIRSVGGDWKQYKRMLKAKQTDPKARLVFRFKEPATLWFDMVSLFPRNTYEKRPGGLRADLMAKLHELQPQFLRFPGGCVVEGCTLDNRIQWKKTVGPIAQRPGHWDLWGYRASDGLGFHEFLQMAEDLGAQAMYVVNVGMSCQGRRPEVAANAKEIIDVYVQDTLDALEYAMGSEETTWGAQRVKNGRPEPFRIKYVEIGNENSGPDYHRAYNIFYAAIKAKYPDIITIADQPIGDSPVEIIDEHYYVEPEWFFANSNRYDIYDRKGPKIYVGEYAVNRGVGSGNLLGALSEAAFMMGMENNSDIVVMASYAPLFENVNDREWPVNLIRFDSSRVIGRSSFYVQKLFAEHLPTMMVETKVSGLPAPEAPQAAGRIGLRTWLTDAQFKDIRVTKGDQLLYASDFAAGAEGWRPRSGDWKVENGVYRQADLLATDTLTTFGEPDWSDYTLQLKAKRNAGQEGFIIVFRNQGRDHVQWNLGGWGNTRHAIQTVSGSSASIVVEAPGSIDIGRWYDVKIVLDGNRVDCFLDGQRIHSTEVKKETPADFFANAGVDEAEGETVIKLVNAAAESRQVQLNLFGFDKVDNNARVFTISGQTPEDENSFDEPLKLAPVESKFKDAAPNFIYTTQPWSVTVLRLKVKN